VGRLACARLREGHRRVVGLREHRLDVKRGLLAALEPRGLAAKRRRGGGWAESVAPVALEPLVAYVQGQRA
jgi:hypothetical protein